MPMHAAGGTILRYNTVQSRGAIAWPALQVRVRCRCSEPGVCGVEAGLAESYARGAPFWKLWGRHAKLVG